MNMCIVGCNDAAADEDDDHDDDDDDDDDGGDGGDDDADVDDDGYDNDDALWTSWGRGKAQPEQLWLDLFGWLGIVQWFVKC